MLTRFNTFVQSCQLHLHAGVSGWCMVAASRFFFSTNVVSHVLEVVFPSPLGLQVQRQADQSAVLCQPRGGAAEAPTGCRLTEGIRSRKRAARPQEEQSFLFIWLISLLSSHLLNSSRNFEPLYLNDVSHLDQCEDSSTTHLPMNCFHRMCKK